MKKINLLVVLSFITLLGVNAQERDDSPAGVAKRGTESLKSLVKIDSLTEKKVYNCFLEKYNDYYIKTKEGVPISKQFKQTRLEIDSCLKKVLTKNQYDVWKTDDEELSYNKHDRRETLDGMDVLINQDSLLTRSLNNISEKLTNINLDSASKSALTKQYEDVGHERQVLRTRIKDWQTRIKKDFGIDLKPIKEE